MDTPFYFIGIDVAKLKFDVATKKSANRYLAEQFSNDSQGFIAFSAWLKKQKIKTAYIVIEATNIYHEALCEYLHKAGFNVAVINPKSSANLAKGLNIRSKTDKVDAKLLARLGEIHHEELRLWTPRPQAEQTLRRQLRQIEHLKQLKAKERTRLSMLLDEDCIASSQALIAHFDEQIRQLQRKIDRLVKTDDSLKRHHALLMSIPAIGKNTACWLLAHLGDGSRFKNGKAAATYAGLTPAHKQSGSSLDKHLGISRVGQSDLRKILYTPAMAFCFGVHKDSFYAPFVQRLLGNQVAKKAVIVALMRKLVTIAQSILKYQQPFDEKRYANLA